MIVNDLCEHWSWVMAIATQEQSAVSAMCLAGFDVWTTLRCALIGSTLGQLLIWFGCDVVFWVTRGIDWVVRRITRGIDWVIRKLFPHFELKKKRWNRKPKAWIDRWRDKLHTKIEGSQCPVLTAFLVGCIPLPLALHVAVGAVRILKIKYGFIATLLAGIIRTVAWVAWVYFVQEAIKAMF